MKKNITGLSIATLFVLGLFIVQGQIQSNQVTTSVLGDVVQSESAPASSSPSRLGIGAIPIQEKDGQPASSFFFSTDPGSKLEGILRLQNQNNDTDLVADVYVVGSNPNSSLPTPMPRKAPGPEAAWINIAKRVPVKKSAFRDVPFTISIPGNARPGDHTLSIMVETIRPEDLTKVSKQVTQGATIKISSAVGTRVALKISGKEVISAKIKDLTMTSKDPYTFNVAVENTGNVTIKPRITTTIDSALGTVPQESVPLSTMYEILPGGVATMVTIWDYKKMGMYTLHFTITYGDTSEVRDVKIVIYPTLAQVAIALLLLGAVIAGVIYYIRRRGQQPPPPMPSVQSDAPPSPPSPVTPVTPPPQDAPPSNTPPTAS